MTPETAEGLNRRTTALAPALSGLAILLSTSIFINYVDRGNLSIAAPLMKDELRLSPSQLGILFSSFFWTYAPFQAVSGWLVDRFPVNTVLALGFSLWSAATFCTGLVRGFTLLLLMRLVLGVGESVAYPSYSKIISRHFAEWQRGRANSIIGAGQALGPAFGAFLGGILLPHAGWRFFFMILGLSSALWLIPWRMHMRNEVAANAPPPEPSAHRHNAVHQIPGPGASIAQILSHRSAWGTFAGLFAYNYVWYFFITWLPSYLSTQRDFSIQGMSGVTGAALLLLACSTLASGWASDQWISAGATPTRVRKTLMGVGPVLASAIVLVGVVQSHSVAVALLLLTCIGLGMCNANIWATTQTLAGPAASGKWTGLQNGIGNLAGWVAPPLIGLLVQHTGSFFWAFLITGVVSLLGAAAWVFLVGPLVPIRWSEHPGATAA